jgi:serpin B
MVGEISQKRKLSQSLPPPRPYLLSESLKKSVKNQTGVALEITEHLFSNPEFTQYPPLPMASVPPSPSFVMSKSLKKSIENQTGVALEITKHLFSNQEISDKNIVFSPLSVHVILSMITAGTKGENQHQKLKFLKSKSIEEVNTLAEQVYPLVFADGSPRGGPLLSFINGLWIEQSLSPKCGGECLQGSSETS